MMQKVDWRKTLKHLYVPAARKVVEVDVPEMRFLMVNGEKAPGISDAFAGASQALYALSYALKFVVKKREAVDYGVSPLEGLWWSEEMGLFGFEDEEAMRRTLENRGAWRWTAMIMQPELVSEDLVEEAREESRGRRTYPPSETSGSSPSARAAQPRPCTSGPTPTSGRPSSGYTTS